jgi:hypothetical protein
MYVHIVRAICLTAWQYCLNWTRSTQTHSVHTFYGSIFNVIIIVSVNKIHYLCGHIIIINIITIVFIITTKAIMALKFGEV